MQSYLPFAFFGIFLVVIVFFVYRRQRASSAWQKFADEHGLQVTSAGFFGGFQMKGGFRDESIQVETEQRRTGRNRTTYTVYTVELPPAVPMDLVMYDESLFSKVGKFFGGEDIEVGRPEFDGAFIIKGSHPDEIREFLDRDVVAEALLDLYDFCGDMHIEHQTLKIAHRGLAHQTSTLETNLEPLVRCTKVLKNACEANAIGTMETYESESHDEADREPVAEW